MWHTIKTALHKILPQPLVLFYHYALAVLGQFLYGFPGQKLIIIGITGTKGKTSAAHFVWSVLNAGGIKTGLISTATISLGEKTFPNPWHMTMPGRFKIPSLMSKMLKKNLTHLVLEVTSQGLSQYRASGISFDIAIFTNLTEEHLEAHGGFAKYRQAKKILFESLQKSLPKKWLGKPVPKTIIVNADDPHGEFYQNSWAEQKITYSLEGPSDYQAKILSPENGDAGKNSFVVNQETYQINLPGEFNVLNTLPAIVVGEIFALPKEQIKNGLENLKFIPGRMEEIILGQSFKIFVDYAHEPAGLTKVLNFGRKLAGAENKLIVLTGGQGGGRDKRKRAIMGEIAGKMADYVVVTNEDPYEDDPEEIIKEVGQGSIRTGKKLGKNLFFESERLNGLKKALSLAQKNDVIIVAGKGAEKTMAIKGKLIPWSDHEKIKEILQSFKSRF